MGRIYRERTTRRTLANMDRRIKAQGSASVLARSGLSVPEEGVPQADGTLLVRGDFIADGKDSNEALENPTKPGTVYASITGFGLTVGLVNILTTTVVVPDGFTIAHAMMAGRVFAYNSTTGRDYLYVQTNIAGYNGWALPLGIEPNDGSGINNSAFATVLSGLTPGSSFTVQVAAGTSFAPWAADPGHTAEVSGLITWYR